MADIAKVKREALQYIKKHTGLKSWAEVKRHINSMPQPQGRDKALYVGNISITKNSNKNFYLGAGWCVTAKLPGNIVDFKL